MTKEYEFIWHGLDEHNLPIKGTVSAPNRIVAKAKLRHQAINFQRVHSSFNNNFIWFKTAKLNKADIIFFTRQLSLMLKAGLSISKSLAVIEKACDKPKLKQLCGQLHQNINIGQSLSKSLEEHPKYFKASFIQMLELGEQSGNLISILNRLADHQEYIQQLKIKIKKALIYPMIVLITALLIAILMLVKVVPIFEELFTSFDAPLPAITQTTINLSQHLTQYIWLYLLLVIVLILSIYQAIKRSIKFNYYLNKIALKTPLLRRLLEQQTLARFSRTLSIGLNSGLPLINCLENCINTSSNLLYRQAFINIKQQITQGYSLHQSLEQEQMFPNLLIQITASGEESGSLVEMLSKIADYYETELDSSLTNLTSLLEPIMMIIMGVLVGGLVLSMYLPIFQLGAAI